MTNREYYEAILAIENLSDELKAETEAKIERLNAQAESRKKAVNKKKEKENAPLKAKILEYLGKRNEEGKLVNSKALTSKIAEYLECHPSKVTPLCKSLVEEGKVIIEEVKVPKMGKRNAYTIVESHASAEAE